MAIEEMGHLVMVANLAVAVGGRPHFVRPNFPVAPGYFPSGIVVRLTRENCPQICSVTGSIGIDDVSLRSVEQ